MVAHRLSTVRNAHQIIVVDEGKIVETGTHEEPIDIRRVGLRLAFHSLALWRWGGVYLAVYYPPYQAVSLRSFTARSHPRG